MSGSEIAVVAVVGFGSAVFGALVGGVTTALLEVWKQVLAGVAAARVIRYEMFDIVTNVNMVLVGKGEDVTLPDDAWKAHRLALAPLLSESQMYYLWREHALLPQAQNLMRRVGHVSGPPRVDEGEREELRTWISDLTRRNNELQEVECRNQICLWLSLLLRSLLFPRRATEIRELAATLEAARSRGNVEA